jgi:hypothetical protein
MTRAYTFVTPEERAEMVKLFRQGHTRAFIARFMGRSLRTVRDAINTAIAKSEPLQHCPVCGVLIAPGQPCPDCEADKREKQWREMELDTSFGGPTLPPKERVVREGPPMCEVMLGG